MIKELDLQELQEIYATRMRDDFPPEEIKPFSSIAAMYSRGEYKGLAMKNGEATLAYAFLVICRIPEPAVLLDYFAVNRETRGQGIGSAMMERLIARARQSRFEQIELEVVSTNRRAVGLYLRHGFQLYGTRPHGIKYPDGRYADEDLMRKVL